MSDLMNETDQLAQLARQIVEMHCLPEQAKNSVLSGGTPDQDAIGSLVGLLRDIVFPGFKPSRQLEKGQVVEHVHHRTLELREQLGRVVDWAIKQDGCADHHGATCKSLTACSDQVVDQFIHCLPEISGLLKCDVIAAFDGDPACKSLQEIIICYPGFLAVTVYRFANQLQKMGVPLLPRMMSEWVHGETGIDIHPGATIGKSFFVDHGTGVVIGETCVIGDHVKIYQGVTLGALSFPKDGEGQVVRNTKRHPTIEDRVVLYANAIVLGGTTTVGHDCVVGSNVWLTRSVKPHTTVVMEKPNLRMRSETPGEFEPPLDFQI
ncbi:serine acetyltransferase [bacterium]|nr:serine acetyltransferase [bacterium]